MSWYDEPTVATREGDDLVAGSSAIYDVNMWSVRTFRLLDKLLKIAWPTFGGLNETFPANLLKWPLICKF